MGREREFTVLIEKLHAKVAALRETGDRSLELEEELGVTKRKLEIAQRQAAEAVASALELERRNQAVEIQKRNREEQDNSLVLEAELRTMQQKFDVTQKRLEQSQEELADCQKRFADRLAEN